MTHTPEDRDSDIPPGTDRPPSGRHQSVLRSLSFLEKAALLSGGDTWQSRAVPRIGLSSITMSDGPHGLRKQAGAGDHLGINASVPSTCFPTAATVANSWDPSLGERIGRALGLEAALIGVDVVLGPGLNIKRSPLGGRSFEYFSEDPYLSGRMAAGYVRGIQSAGVAACPKHFAANSQETRRMVSDSVIDEATLREIYLRAFEIVVRESHPRAIMSSYNRLNGTYTNENRHLLQEILRDEWGFDGAVLTDWGGGDDPVAAVAAGGTLQMPSPGFDSVRQLLESGQLDLDALDRRVAEMLDLAERLHPDPAVTDSVYADHRALAREAAEESLVLLRNEDGILPLARATRVAVIGDFATTPRYQGAGSSLVNPTHVAVPIEELRESGLDVVGAARGFIPGAPPDPVLIDEGARVAGSADAVLLYLGLDEFAESEGKDRDHLRLPEAQVELLHAVAATGTPVIVVLAAGSVVEMPWIESTRAILHGYLMGQEGASAVVRALLGEVTPSGRLAETYPLTLADTPTAGRFPVDGPVIAYREGPFIGYRYYSSARVPVRFPFGFGLSYTTFAYSDLEVAPDGARVAVTVTNTGERAGADVPQVYVAGPAPSAGSAPATRTARELAGFAKVRLEPGASQRVVIPLDDRAFERFDATRDRWTTTAGEHTVSVGRHVEDLALSGTVTRAPDPASSSPSARTVGPARTLSPRYAAVDVHALTDEDFETLLGRPVPQAPTAGGPLDRNSPLCDLEHARSWVGRAVYSQYFRRALARMERTGRPDLNLLFQYGMPFRAIANMSGGLAGMGLVDGLLTLVNGHFFRGLGQIVGRFLTGRKRERALAADFRRLAAAGPGATPATAGQPVTPDQPDTHEGGDHA